jgi:hypothetical protein
MKADKQMRVNCIILSLTQLLVYEKEVLRTGRK